MRGPLRRLNSIDWLIILPAAYLLIIGLTIQAAIARKETGIELEIDLNVQFLAVTLGVMTVIILQLGRLLKKQYFSMLLYSVSIALLVAVALFGVEANGSQRWVSIGGFQLQPTEFTKLGLVLILARIFDNRDATINRIRTLVQSLLLTLIPSALILLQPDLGSTVVLFVIWIAILFASRLKLSRLAFIGIAIVSGVIVLIPFMAEYQQERLVSYFNPEKDTAGSSYNVLQAGIAIGSGGLTGTGIDSGTQSQLNFLPSQHTDFVFAVTAEKLGLIGAMSTIVAYMIILSRLLYLAWWTSSQFERGVLVGISAFMFFHVFVNIGMNLGLVPVTGLPLPLLSYGGTFLFVMIVSLGIANILSSSIRKRDWDGRLQTLQK